MVNLHFLLKFSKNINIQQTSTSRNYRWSAYIFYHWKYVYGKIFPDKEHYPSQPNVFIAYLPSRAGNDICHIALSMSSSHYILTGKKKHLSLDVAIIINVDNIIFSKWTSLRKPSSISGIQSWRSMAWRRSRGRRCSRRCLGSGSWRTRRSTTSSSESLTFNGSSCRYQCHNIFSVHITISCQMNFDDYPLDAHACQFQVGSCEYSKLMKINHQPVCLKCFRLWHRGGGDV